MSNNKNKNITFFFSIAGIISFLIVVYVGWTLKLDNVIIEKKEVVNFNNGWYFEKDGQKESILSLPYIFNFQNDDKVTFYNKIPEDLKEDMILCLESSHQMVRAFINQKQVYEYGISQKSVFDKPSGNTWIMIEIPKSAAGQEVSITLSTLLFNRCKLNKMTLGSKSATIIYLLTKNFGIILFCSFTFLLAVIFMIAAIVLKKRSINCNHSAYLYLGVFVFLASVWTLTDSWVLQFIVGNMASVFLLSFISFMLFPIPILLFVKESCSVGKRLLSALCLCYIIHFFVALCLFLLDFAELFQLLFITHFLILISIVSIVVICCWEWKKYKNKSVREILLALVLLSMFSVVALVKFYCIKDLDNSQSFRYGIIAFISCLSVGTFRQSYKLIQASNMDIPYKNDLVDEMTQLKNITAFHKEMNERKQWRQCKSIAFVVLDINNLKGLNELHGFHAGDNLLKAVSECICNAFSTIGTCFRMKSDEFTIILLDKNMDEIEIGMERLKEIIDDYNQMHRDKIELYYGISMTDKKLDTATLYSLLNDANTNMYYNKYRSISEKQRLFL